MIEFIQDILDFLLKKIKKFSSNFKAWLDKKSQENAEMRLKQIHEEAVMYLDRNYRYELVKELKRKTNDQALLREYKLNPQIIDFIPEKRGLNSYWEIRFKGGFHTLNNAKETQHMLEALTNIRLETARVKFKEYKNIAEPFEFIVSSSKMVNGRIYLTIRYKMSNA